MSRRRGFISTLIQLDRAARRAQAGRQRAAVREQRQAERALRAVERLRFAASREQKRAYVESRLAEVRQQNAELEQTVAALESILQSGLTRSPPLDLDTLKKPMTEEPFEPGDLAHASAPPALDPYLPLPLSWLGRLVPGAKATHERLCEEARQRFASALRAHAEAQNQRRQSLEQARLAHEGKVAEARRHIEAQHVEVEELKRAFQARDADAVAAYFTLVLDRSEYPDGFSGSPEVTYEPEPKLLDIDMELPAFEIVPEVGSYRYIKSKDEILESPRSAKERRGLYSGLIARTALRTLHEVFSADKPWQTIDTVAFRGYVKGIDRGTGQPARPCIVSVRASPDPFMNFDLRQVEPTACLHALHGVVSKSPETLTPVGPSFELNAVDPRAGSP